MDPRMLVWLGVMIGLPVAWILLQAVLPEKVTDVITGLAIVSWVIFLLYGLFLWSAGLL